MIIKTTKRKAQNKHLLHSLKACFSAKSLSQAQSNWRQTSADGRFHEPMTFFLITIFPKSAQSDVYLHIQNMGCIQDFQISLLAHFSSHAMLAPSSTTLMCHPHFWYHFKAESLLNTPAWLKSIHKHAFPRI